ncbi:MAG: NusG domain II-containing protein, partial [Treponema sp.]|nr:NusG domain II-containing protein [Treponema sp.]
AALIVFFSFRVYAPGEGAARLVVEGEGRRWDFPLDAAEILRVAGPLGDTVVELGGREAKILSSPCPNQSCIAAGEIRRPGQWIACLPNRVMVRVEAAAPEEQDLDAASW